MVGESSGVAVRILAIQPRAHYEDENEFTANGVLKLSETRWIVLADCLKRIIDNYGTLRKV